MNFLRAHRGFWLPLVVGFVFGAILGAWIGSIEARSCGTELSRVGLVLGTGFLVLFGGGAIGIGGLFAIGIGLWRREPKTTYSGLGVLLAGLVVPVTFFVVTGAFATAGCGPIRFSPY